MEWILIVIIYAPIDIEVWEWTYTTEETCLEKLAEVARIEPPTDDDGTVLRVSLNCIKVS